MDAVLLRIKRKHILLLLIVKRRAGELTNKCHPFWAPKRAALPPSAGDRVIRISASFGPSTVG